MKKTIQVEVNFKSFVETLIDEFTGIPGIEFIIDTPHRFRLKSTVKSESIFNEVIVREETSNSWIFSIPCFSQNLINSDGYEEVFRTNLNQIQEYVQYDLLKDFLKASYRYIREATRAIKSQGYNDGKDVIVPSTYIVPTAYLNLGVKLGILLCGTRTLVTECHFVDNGATVTIFDNKLVANDMVSNYDKLVVEVEELRSVNSSQLDYIEQLSEEIAELNRQLLSHIISEDSSEQLPAEVTEASAEVLSLVSNTSLGEPNVNDTRKAIQLVNDTIAGFDFPVT